MPVSKKPRKPYIKYEGQGDDRLVKVNHNRSATKLAGGTKILNLLSKATQGDVLSVPRTVHHMLAYNGISA